MLEKYFEPTDREERLGTLLQESRKMLDNISPSSPKKKVRKKSKKKVKSYASEQPILPELLPPDKKAWEYCGNFIPEGKNCSLQDDTREEYLCSKGKKCCCFCRVCENWMVSCDYMSFQCGD